MGPVELVTIGGVISLLVLAARLNTAAERRIDAGWREAARIVKGRIGDGERKLSVTLDGVDLVADELRQGKAVYTRIRAGVSGSMGLDLTVKRASVFRSVEHVFSEADGSGDLAFDSDFDTAASNREIARLWLHAPARAAMRASGDWSFSLSRGTLTVVVGFLLSDGTRLARALRSAAAIARRGLEIEREWADLARDLGGVVTKAFTVAHAELGVMTIQRERIEIRLSVRRTESGAQTVFSATAPPKIDDDAQRGFVARGESLGAKISFEGGRVVVELPRISFAKKKLDDLLDLLGDAAATTSLVPYR